MKRLILLLVLLLPLVVAAQTKADYEKVMSKFVNYYNKKQGNNIVKLWEFKDRKSIERLWTWAELNKLHEKYGTIVSCKYLAAGTGENRGVAFTTIFSKLEPNGTNIVLTKQNYIDEFMLITSEPKDKVVAGKK